MRNDFPEYFFRALAIGSVPKVLEPESEARERFASLGRRDPAPLRTERFT